MPRKASPSATKWSRSPRPRLLAALDRLDGVLDQVGERLAYLAAVAGHHQGLRWRRVAELHLRLRRALQEYSLLDEPADVLPTHHRCRHPRKGRELVDHAPDVADVAHDGIGADLEGLGVARDLADILALQALGGELDRGRSEEHTSELQSLMRISYAVFCLQ